MCEPKAWLQGGEPATPWTGTIPPNVSPWESHKFLLKALWTKQNLTSGQILPASLDCADLFLCTGHKIRQTIHLKGKVKILIPTSQLRVGLISPDHTVLFSGPPKSMRMVTATTKLRHLLLGRIAMTNLNSVLKSREITLPTEVHLVKAMVFPLVVWMWELDHKEGWSPKNWCFWTMVLEETLGSPLDSKEISQS